MYFVVACACASGRVSADPSLCQHVHDKPCVLPLWPPRRSTTCPAWTWPWPTSPIGRSWPSYLAVAVLVRSDVHISAGAAKLLSYVLAIGLKMTALAAPPATWSARWRPRLIVAAVIPVVAYLVLQRWGRFSVVDAAGIAAHYGSVSASASASSPRSASRLPRRPPRPGRRAQESPASSSPSPSPTGSQGGSLRGAVTEVLAGSSMLLLLRRDGHRGGGRSGRRELVAQVFVTPFPACWCSLLTWASPPGTGCGRCAGRGRSWSASRSPCRWRPGRSARPWAPWPASRSAAPPCSVRWRRARPTSPRRQAGRSPCPRPTSATPSPRRWPSRPVQPCGGHPALHSLASRLA